MVFKKITHERAGGVAQVVEHLPSKCKALSSIPSTVKKIIDESEKAINRHQY
jgi:hypothetical protein